jgi:hypothetical protein
MWCLVNRLTLRRGGGQRLPGCFELAQDVLTLGTPDITFGVVVALGAEGKPLLVAETLGDAGDQLAIEIVQRGEQGERPVADIVVGLGLDVADAERQTGRRARERAAKKSICQ